MGIFTQEYETYYDQSSCETDWVEVGEGIAECSPNPIVIPADCSNITTWLEAVPVFDSYNDKGCNQGNYHLTTCNPSYECFSQDYPCSQINVSLTDEYNNYFAGETITGKGTLRVDNICRCEFLFWDYGIKRFRLRVSSNLECQVNCKEEWFCLNDDYKAFKQVDCSQTNVTLCDNGCSSGGCLGFGDEGSEFSTSSIWGRYFINPSREIKFLYALSGSLVLGFLGMLISHGIDNKNKSGGLIFAIMFGVGFAFFTLLGWIPAVIILIIIFFTGIYTLFKTIG